MSHPFEVGKTYRNRIGEYVVLSIDDEKMKIRYADGGTLETNVNIQARIWENIQFEERASRAEERRRLAQEARLAARKRTRQIKAKPEFGGFLASDFEAKARGIAWQNRQSLGKVVAYELRQRTKQSFAQWIVPRRPVIHVARKDQYDPETRDRNAAFFATATEEGLSYGLHIEKPAGPIKAGWNWSHFMSALAEDEQFRAALRATMEKFNLSLDVYAMQTKYGLIGRFVAPPDGAELLWQQETADQEILQSLTWDGVVEQIQAQAGEERAELQLTKRMVPDDAVGRGSEIVNEIMQVFEESLPLYDASVGL
jgi:hypothetical protein